MDLPLLTVEQVDGLRSSADDLAQLTEHLRAAHYTTDSIRDFLQLEDPPAAVLSKTALFAHLMGDELSSDSSRLGTLARLFFLGGRVSQSQLSAGLSADLRELLERRRLIFMPEPGQHEATVAITELGGRWMLSDKLFRHLGEGRITLVPRPVMPMHASSCELYAHLRQKPGATSFLDIGCGSGCQAILADQRYQRVVGFDIDPRSVAFSRLNAALNRSHAQFSVADGLAFSDGAPFDHVAWNAESIPPFATPDTTDLGHGYLLHFLGERLDALLAPGGSAQIWTIFFLPTRTESIAQLLAPAVGDRFRVEVNVLPRSPFTVGAAELARGQIPRGSYLAGDDEERRLLLDFVRRNQVREILAAVVTLQR
jgi:methylase of polypeptide subunit release factors